MFLYNGIKITGAWKDNSGTSYPRGWVEGAEPQQLIDIGVETVADIPYPVYDADTQAVTENPDGSYTVSPLSSDHIRAKAKNNLNTNLNAMTYTYLDGRVIQTRPSDLTNFQLAISKGQDEEWVMADNSLSIMTVAELQEALNAAIVQGGIYWDEYKDVIRSLP